MLILIENLIDEVIDSPVAFETVETSMDVAIRVTDVPAQRLNPHDIASWGSFLPDRARGRRAARHVSRGR